MIIYDRFLLAHKQSIDCDSWHGLVDGVRVSLSPDVKQGGDTSPMSIELELGDINIVGLNWPGCYTWIPEWSVEPDVLSDENRQAVEKAINEFREELDAYRDRVFDTFAWVAMQGGES